METRGVPTLHVRIGHDFKLECSEVRTMRAVALTVLTSYHISPH